MKSLIAIQQEYIDTVNAGHARWAHRPKGGHLHRSYRGARHAAEKAFQCHGCFTPAQIDQMIRDARDMAELERIAE